MKKLENLISLFILIIFTTFSDAILSGYDQQQRHDLTEDRRFGCYPQGGSITAVICNCREDAEVLYIAENSLSSYDTNGIEINNCSKVVFGQLSINEMRNLRTINLNNIESLEFQQTSLKWYGYRNRNQFEERYDISIPSLKIIINNSKIKKISSYTFEGRINTIEFNNVIIDEIEPFAFNSLLQTHTIKFNNCELKTIHLQPFKKFSLENLILDNVRTMHIPSRFLSNLTVYEKFVIKNCKFETIRSGAFQVFNPIKFEVINTKINHLDGEAFKVTTRGDVLFKNNQFNRINDGAFQAITLNRDEVLTSPTFVFDSNLFSILTTNSLNLNDNDFLIRIINLYINQTCDCRDIDHNIKNNLYYTEIKCLFNNNNNNNNNNKEGDFITIQEYKKNWCSIIQSYSTTIIIIGVVLILLIIIITVLIIYYKKVYLSRKYGGNNNNNNIGNISDTKKTNMSLIVPDGRTYRETELHVIVERADLLTTDL